MQIRMKQLGYRCDLNENLIGILCVEIFFGTDRQNVRLVGVNDCHIVVSNIFTILKSVFMSNQKFVVLGVSCSRICTRRS